MSIEAGNGPLTVLEKSHPLLSGILLEDLMYTRKSNEYGVVRSITLDPGILENKVTLEINDPVTQTMEVEEWVLDGE